MSTETGRDTAWLHEAERSDLVRPKPTGRPHVLAIVLDDTGFGHLGCFGSTISTPNIDRLAAEGLRYSRFHVTAMCSPTRAAFFTGRNAHHVGMGFVADIPLDHPGYTGRIHPSAATSARLLRDAGWATRAIGKWHLVPRYERSDAGPFTSWPLGSSATTGSSRATRTSTSQISSRTTTTSSSIRPNLMATTCPRTSSTEPCPRS